MDPLYVGSIWKKKPNAAWKSGGAWLMEKVVIKEVNTTLPTGKIGIYFGDGDGKEYIGGQLTSCHSEDFREMYEPL